MQDERQHDNAVDCWCEPRIANGLVIHQKPGWNLYHSIPNKYPDGSIFIAYRVCVRQKSPLPSVLPPEAQAYIDKLKAILDEAKNTPPHVCEDGCRCRAAYRRELVRGLGLP